MSISIKILFSGFSITENNDLLTAFDKHSPYPAKKKKKQKTKTTTTNKKIEASKKKSSL